MKMLRVRIVVAFAKLWGVPIKVRESYWLGDDHMTGEAQSGQTSVDEMTDTELAELREEAVRIVEHVKLSAIGDDMQCPQCGMNVPIRRDFQTSRWDVECGCGWNAAGSGPPQRKN